MRGFTHLEIEMLNNIISETNITYDAQLRLFINANIDHEVGLYGNNYYPEIISFVSSDLALFRNEHYFREDRFYTWLAHSREMRVRASLRLRNRLAYADSRPYNPDALGHLFRSMACRIACRRPFAPLAEAVRDTLKADRAGDRAGQRAGKQRLIELAYNCDYATLVYEVMGKHWTILLTATHDAQYRFGSGHWKAPVWVQGDWIDRHPAHFVHASRETPGNVAFYADTDKLEADKLTSMKPGRYLSVFYGAILSDEEIKQLANKQMVATRPAELKFVGNNDPLGWVWVYENSSPSCMRYNRSNRYIKLGLKGDRHPVTVYAHPDNNLSLAYTMLPGIVEDRTVNSHQDEYVIGGRAIVNTRDKTYLRIYAAGDVQFTELKEALERAGYTKSNNTLYKEKLRLEAAEAGYLCPYLDGNYPYVQVRSSHLLVGDGGICAHETAGYIIDKDEDEDRYYCEYCDTSYCEDDGNFIESANEWVCDDCRREHFVWASGRRGTSELHRNESEDIVYCDYDGNYYVTDYLDDNGMGMTEDGEVYPEDQLVETEDGVYHMRDAVELTYEFNGYQWAQRGSAYRLPNGETCHVDDEDKIAEIEALEQEAA